MSLYTRTGDEGKTNVGERRKWKDCPDVEVTGEIDEFVSLLGTIASELEEPEDIEKIISDLVSLNAHIMSEGKYSFAGQTDWLEKRIDKMWAETGELHYFILRFTDPLASKIHYARAVCRRVERKLVAFSRNAEWMDKNATAYINRLSDYLFALARWINRERGGKEITWAAK